MPVMIPGGRHKLAVMPGLDCTLTNDTSVVLAARAAELASCISEVCCRALKKEREEREREKREREKRERELQMEPQKNEI